jgi:hypothetical protein
MAMLLVPAIAQDYGLATNGGVDILGTAIFETDGSAFKFPSMQETNLDNIVVGNDMALAFGNIWKKDSITTAINNLDIKNRQDSGSCCNVNMGQIKIGNRRALAFGVASAANNIKILSSDTLPKERSHDWLPNI